MVSDLFDLKWLLGDQIQQIEHSSESDRWLFRFTSGSFLSVECLWRLRVEGVLIATSSDHGHQFGLPAPFDAVDSLHQYLDTLSISAVNIGHKTADLQLWFGDSKVLEVVQDSAGYEPWQASCVQIFL